MLGTDLMTEFDSEHQVRGIDRKEIDITQLEQCQAQIDQFRPDTIINAAALTDVDYCETHEDEALRVNGYGAGNLSKAAASAGGLLVHYSTDYVFDGSKKEAYVEEDTPNPQSVYGRSKLLGEDLVRKHCPNHLIIRNGFLAEMAATSSAQSLMRRKKESHYGS